jgi:hypothetical protein
MKFENLKKGQKIIAPSVGADPLLVKKVSADKVHLENIRLKQSVELPKSLVDAGRLQGYKVSNGDVKKSSTPENPQHYRQGKIEPWDFITDQGLNYFAGNVVKYISRYAQKNGVEDLKKAKTYLEKLILIEEESK